MIGKISYTYNNKEVGGTSIYYADTKPPTLNDSIDMSKWFDDAVEEVNRPPFPWKKVVLISILVLVILFSGFFIFRQIRAERENRIRRNRYRKTNRRYRRADRRNRL